METIILIGAVGYAVLSGLFLVALLQSAARTTDDWTTSTLPTNQTLAETNLASGRACDYEAAVDAPPLMLAVRRRS
jgi:hypothetical protein